MKDVLEPAFVLLLAWALGDVIGAVRTAEWIASALHGGMPRWALPPAVSLLGYAISSACGTSFGAIGIMLPLVGPIALKLGGDDYEYLLHCIGSVRTTETTVVLPGRAAVAPAYQSLIGHSPRADPLPTIFPGARRHALWQPLLADLRHQHPHRPSH